MIYWDTTTTSGDRMAIAMIAAYVLVWAGLAALVGWLTKGLKDDGEWGPFL